jgi:hypothetical protein
VAWLWVQAQGQQPYLVAYGPDGRQVARLNQFTAPGFAAVYGVWRSPDGALVFTATSSTVTAYSAADGSQARVYRHEPGEIIGDAFSQDSHYLALLLFDGTVKLQVLDLQLGTTTGPVLVPHDPAAKLPGMSGAATAWGQPVFGPDPSLVYTISDWGGPARLSAFSLQGGQLKLRSSAVDGQDGHMLPDCAGPALVARIVDSGSTMATYCNFNAKLAFIDLRTLSQSGLLRPSQGNPFWGAPIFTPDGQLMYMRVGQDVQVVDLTRRVIRGPVPLPRKTSDQTPFAWLRDQLATPVEAGGIATTVPLSPDGLRYYAAEDLGIMVLRIPDLKPIGKLATGTYIDEVWVSGDGRTIYAIADHGHRLIVVRDDGGSLSSIDLPATAGGYVASEHG